MKQDRLGSRRQAADTLAPARAEVFAQIDGEVRNIELVARHDERYAISDEACAAVRAQCRRDEHDNCVDSGANQASMLCDVGRLGAMAFGDKEDAAPSCNAAVEDPVYACEKRGQDGTW